MIPADHATIDDNTLLIVMPPDPITDGLPDYWNDLNRPCDTCGGTGERHYDDAPPRLDGCPACDGYTRHTFDVEVEPGSLGESLPGRTDLYPPDEPPNRYRVHVIDVLSRAGQRWYTLGISHVALGSDRPLLRTWEYRNAPITDPPKATGMFLVRCHIHNKETP